MQSDSPSFMPIFYSKTMIQSPHRIISRGVPHMADMVETPTRRVVMLRIHRRGDVSRALMCQPSMVESHLSVSVCLINPDDDQDTQVMLVSATGNRTAPFNLYNSAQPPRDYAESDNLLNWLAEHERSKQVEPQVILFSDIADGGEKLFADLQASLIYQFSGEDDSSRFHLLGNNCADAVKTVLDVFFTERERGARAIRRCYSFYQLLCFAPWLASLSVLSCFPPLPGISAPQDVVAMGHCFEGYGQCPADLVEQLSVFRGPKEEYSMFGAAASFFRRCCGKSAEKPGEDESPGDGQRGGSGYSAV